MMTGFTTWVESDKFKEMMWQVKQIRESAERTKELSNQEFLRVRDIAMHITGMQNGCRLGAMRALTWGKYFHRRAAYFPRGQTNYLNIPDSWQLDDASQEGAEMVGTFAELYLTDGSVKNPGWYSIDFAK